MLLFSRKPAKRGRGSAQRWSKTSVSLWLLAVYQRAARGLSLVFRFPVYASSAALWFAEQGPHPQV